MHFLGIDLSTQSIKYTVIYAPDEGGSFSLVCEGAVPFRLLQPEFPHTRGPRPPPTVLPFINKQVVFNNLFSPIG